MYKRQLLEEKGYDPIVYRFFCLQSHYRKGLVFSWENLDNAKAAFDKLVARVAALTGAGEVDEACLLYTSRDIAGLTARPASVPRSAGRRVRKRSCWD